MPSQWAKDFNLITAAFAGESLVVAMTSEEAAEEMEDLTILAVWQNRQWKLFDDPYLWSVVDAISVKLPTQKTVFLGTWGEILISDSQKGSEELIAPSSGEQPKSRGPMCGIGIVDNIPYAVGMGRQVYQRNPSGQWLCLDYSIRPPADDEDIVGLNSIDGLSQNELYAAGFKGEIWWRNAEQWIFADSPTNLPLSYVFCDGENRTYICGRNGTLLTGRKDKWAFMAQDETDDDLWSIAKYRDQLYILGTHGLYHLENDGLTPVPISGESLGFCQFLLVGLDRLWLVGPKDLLSFDGSTWDRIV